MTGNISVCIQYSDELDLDMIIWRYMSLTKFMSLLTYQALWFSKLNKLEDGLEGTIPTATKLKMQEKNQEWKKVFGTPDFHKQIDLFPQINEDNGRELIIANCWFVGDIDSGRMWKEYTDPENGIAIKSKPRNLLNSVLLKKEVLPRMDMIKYIDHFTYDMGIYQGSQAIERAFIKDKDKFSHEQELRLAALNLKTTNCVRQDGIPYTFQDVNGSGMNNFDQHGLYVRVNVNTLIDEIVISPTAPEYLYYLIQRICNISQIDSNVVRSSSSIC